MTTSKTDISQLKRLRDSGPLPDLTPQQYRELPPAEKTVVATGVETLLTLRDLQSSTSAIRSHLTLQDEQLSAIREQATRTNGRVTQLEKESIAENASRSAERWWIGLLFSLIGGFLVAVVAPLLIWFLTTYVQIRQPGSGAAPAATVTAAPVPAPAPVPATTVP